MCLDACRKPLSQLMDGDKKKSNESLDHPGLALARYLRSQQDNNQAVRQLHNLIKNSKASSAYKAAFGRWERLAKARGSLVFREALKGPLALGLGNESVTEVGLTTHFTYGMPIIPGSAIKGICRRAALLLSEQSKLSQDQFDALIGTQDSASFFTFWDAWYDPDSVEGKPFHRDVITVHHPKYYGSQGKEGGPTDFDDPNPIPFLVVKPNAKFLFAIDAPDEKWGEFVKQLLRWSLRNLGAGGKTNAGYGWFEVDMVQEKALGTASAATPTTKVTLTENEAVWVGATVHRDPGSGKLTATDKENRKALVEGNAAQELFNKLSESAQEALKRKPRKIIADVTVSTMGNNITIKHIQPKG